ncbi:hypothetical protein SAY87_025052 [Trapa incisa]|uniref:Uncharacterized protein n=1 Tax=Trapa incisa TaxID=236973 RepID=A0AAN7GQ46_9MYRT|nr:hypothetical protein SAY87_025052 [Trapa incisa]
MQGIATSKFDQSSARSDRHSNIKPLMFHKFVLLPQNPRLIFARFPDDIERFRGGDSFSSLGYKVTSMTVKATNREKLQVYEAEIQQDLKTKKIAHSLRQVLEGSTVRNINNLKIFQRGERGRKNSQILGVTQVENLKVLKLIQGLRDFDQRVCIA